MNETLTEPNATDEAEVELDYEYRQGTEELSFPKLDGILFPVVVANADVVAPCPWMGGAEVTLTVALNNYYQPMSEENADCVIAEVYNFLANKSLVAEETPDESEVESLAEEQKKEEMVVEVKIKDAPNKLPDKAHKAVESSLEKNKRQQQPAEATREQTAAPPVDTNREEVDAKTEGASSKPLNLPNVADDRSVALPERPPEPLGATAKIVDEVREIEHEEMEQSIPPLVNSASVEFNQNSATIQEQVAELDDLPEVDLEMEHHDLPEIDQPSEVASQVYEQGEVNLEAEETQDVMDFESLTYFSDILTTMDDAEAADAAFEPIVDESVESMFGLSQEMPAIEYSVSHYLHSEIEYETSSWTAEEFGMIFDGETTSIDSLVQSERAVTKANELLLSLNGSLDACDEEVVGVTDDELITGKERKLEELEASYALLSNDIWFAYEPESEGTVVRVNVDKPSEEASDALERLGDIDEQTSRGGRRGTTRKLSAAASTIRTTLQRATAIGRSALRPHIVDSVRWYDLAS